MSKKWLIIQPLPTAWKAPDKKEAWSNHSIRNICRLIGAPATNITQKIDMDSYDIYWIHNFDMNIMTKEIELARKLKERGKKVVLSFSSDLRFLFGGGLSCPEHLIYTDLCAEVDAVLSGLPSEMKVFGRRQHKVVDGGIFLERINKSVQYEQRNIDLLLSTSVGLETLSFNLELLLYIKEKRPGWRIVFCTNPQLPCIRPHVNNIPIEFLAGPLITRLPFTKVFINHEVRPRSGRALEEAFYCRTPCISHKWTALSTLWPKLTFDCMNFETILKMAEYAHNNYHSIVQESEQIAEGEYWENIYKRIMNKLFPEGWEW